MTNIRELNASELDFVSGGTHPRKDGQGGGTGRGPETGLGDGLGGLRQDIANGIGNVLHIIGFA